MSDKQPDDPRDPPVSEPVTERQSPEGLSSSVDLSIPAHVSQNASAPQVAGYVLSELLGEGAYGEVWRAWQIRTRKEVAVKVFRQGGGLDWIFLQREVERLLRLDAHPNIVTLLDAGIDSEPPYYVMEMLSGGSLQQFVVPRSPAPPARVIGWGLQICDALGYVHAKGLIHCDLKPANILIDEQDRVRVVDFGQSRVFTESAASLGTLFYMAPEQATVTRLGEPVQPDIRWDVYAIGATLYALLTGQAPHATSTDTQDLEQAGNLEDRLTRYRGLIGKGPIADSDGVLRGVVGRELAAVIARCLAFRPEDRYETMTALRDDLEALGKRRPVSPLASHRGYRIRKFVQRNPIGMALMGACVVLLLVGVLLRAKSIRFDRQRAETILTQFVQAPDRARADLGGASRRVRRYIAALAGEYVFSPAFTQRVTGARAAPWANPQAFWASVDDGPLWEHGEWLEIATADWSAPGPLIAQLQVKARNGSAREKYVALCLLGQMKPADPQAAQACADALDMESEPGAIAAARWAAGRFGAEPPLRPRSSFRHDEISGLLFVKVPGCESFRRGSPLDEKDRYTNELMPAAGRPIGTFWLATTEVTAAAFAPFLNDPQEAETLAALAGDSADRREELQLAAQALRSQIDKGALHEAAGWASLQMARQYCQWLSLRARESHTGRRYRLCSEDEWEYACRAGNQGRFCFGDNVDYVRFFANCNGDEGSAPVVAQRMPNSFGLFDMHGGLWEWTDSTFPPQFITDSRVDDSQKQDLYVLRGGAYYSPAVRCRSAQRNYGSVDAAGMYWGFRIVMELLEP